MLSQNKRMLTRKPVWNLTGIFMNSSVVCGFAVFSLVWTLSTESSSPCMDCWVGLVINQLSINRMKQRQLFFLLSPHLYVCVPVIYSYIAMYERFPAKLFSEVSWCESASYNRIWSEKRGMLTKEQRGWSLYVYILFHNPLFVKNVLSFPALLKSRVTSTGYDWYISDLICLVT